MDPIAALTNEELLSMYSVKILTISPSENHFSIKELEREILYRMKKNSLMDRLLEM